MHIHHYFYTPAGGQSPAAMQLGCHKIVLDHVGVCVHVCAHTHIQCLSACILEVHELGMHQQLEYVQPPVNDEEECVMEAYGALVGASL